MKYSIDEELLETARKLGPTISEHAEEAELERRPARAVMDALTNAGLQRMFIPKSLGGLEVDPVTYARIAEEIAGFDSVAGWALQAGNHIAWWCARMPNEGVEEVYGNGPDHSPERLARDIATYVGNVGEPCGLVGLSGGGMLSLGAAARSRDVSAVAAYEPIALEVMDRDFEARFGELVARMHEAVADERPVDATRLFLEFVGNDAEVASLNEPESLQIAARNLAVDLKEFRQATEAAARNPTGPASLESIAAPVFLMHGTQTAQEWFTESVRYYAGKIPGAETRELVGSGHLGPVMEPERIAGELERFFEKTREAA